MGKTYVAAMTIAGSDSGGGAGIQADLKTFLSLGVYGTSVVTAVTAQNTRSVDAVEILPLSIIEQQLATTFNDIDIRAVKTGMLPNSEIIARVAAVLRQYDVKNIVVDPVMVATTGARLTAVPVADAFERELFPIASVVTPNITEAEVLSGLSITDKASILRAGEALISKGCKAVLIKGGHTDAEDATDILFRSGHDPVEFTSPRIDTPNLHGTGCTLSSAIASYLALGEGLCDAVSKAKHYISQAICAGSAVSTGRGCGPVDHSFDPQGLVIKDI